MKNYEIALIKGDGIGPEIIDTAVKVLKKVGEIEGMTFNFKEYLMGGAAIDAVGEALPRDAIWRNRRSKMG